MEKHSSLGQHATCKATGFEGVITSRCEYLHGTPMVQVSPHAGDDRWLPEEGVQLGGPAKAEPKTAAV
jgi:hypothetical protein